MMIFYWFYKVSGFTVFLRTLDIVAHGATHAALMNTSWFPLGLEGFPCRSSYSRLGEQQPHSSRMGSPLSILLVLPMVFDGFRITVFWLGLRFLLAQPKTFILPRFLHGLGFRFFGPVYSAWSLKGKLFSCYMKLFL